MLRLAPALALASCAGGALTVYEENDLFSLYGARDRYYTQGLRVSSVFPAAATPDFAKAVAELFPLYDAGATTQIGVVVGQEIYTPKDISRDPPDPEDRPYAGWLHVGVLVANQHLDDDGRAGDVEDTLEVDVGVVGEPSLGEWVQVHWHELIEAPRPRGWDEQIQFEPGLNVAWEERRRLVATGPAECLSLDVLPAWGFAVGNVDVHVAVGATVRTGWNVPRDFGPNTIHSTAMEVTDSSAGDRPSAYVFGGLEGRAVAHSMFLDGNTFRDGPSVDREWLVAEFRAGVAVQWGCLRASYTWITRSEEFDGQQGWSRYGSLSLGCVLDF